MRALDLKLLRDLRRLWAQALAIALVLACGVGILVMSYGAESALRETRATYYERNRFADIFSGATRAPEWLRDEIARIPGVARVQTRISQHAILDVPGLSDPAVGRLLSLPESGAPVMNVPTLTAGRMPAGAGVREVLVNENFAAANGFRPGDSFAVTMNGQKRAVTISGTALSPEFIYTLAPGALMPDDRRFGVIWMPRPALAAAYDLEGAFNDVSLGLARGARPEAVKDRLERLLEPYGGTGPMDRDLQTSHAFLDAELTQLRNTSRTVPPIFLVISAFLVNMVLGRLVALEREQIGLFKALGYTATAIGWHYTKLALLIGAIGVLLGWAFGLWTGRWLAGMYAQFFHFPYLVFFETPATYAVAGLSGLAAAAAGAVLGVRRAVRLRPAVAMAPPAPTRFRQSALDRAVQALGVRQTSMMILRSITRWPVRAALTVLGIATSGAVLVASLFMFDAMDELLDVSFVQTNRQDAVLDFTRSLPLSALDAVEDMPGVLAAEGALHAAARLRNGPRSRLIGIEGRPPGTALTRLFDAESRESVDPGHGIVLTGRLADHLGVRAGDTVSVELLEQDRPATPVPVTAVITQYFGLGAYMDLDRLNGLLHQAPRIDAANIATDPRRQEALFAAVKAAPAVNGISQLNQVRRAFDETISENAGMTMTVNAVLAALIAVGVVYNSARIQLSERARELASLRILGFTRGEVSYILLGELFLLTAVAIPLGWIIGRGIAEAMVASFSSDLYLIPLVIARDTYAASGLIVLAASVGSALIVRRRVDRLDLVAVMKTRE
ncbi:ABC transporter permease [Rhodovulum sp. YNF3179]|uniref:ABC transporter permease n=1 Tax=Rhodovulum sp. YNF3179 TaxID=3425127 RepID=UPI003D3285AB